jgi:multiple sugar transport system substrate-binding protein
MHNTRFHQNKSRLGLLISVVLPLITIALFLFVLPDQVYSIELPSEVENGTLVIDSRLFSPSEEREFFINEIIAPFESEHGVSVTLQILSDDAILESAEQQQNSGVITTDLVLVHNSRMSEWVNLDYVEDLTANVNGWTDRTFIPVFEEDSHRDGNQYFLPIVADVYLLLANNQALPHLPVGADVLDLTWEQYATWSMAIESNTGVGRSVITGVPRTSFIYHFGAAAMSHGAGFPEINSPGAVESWEILLSMKDAFIPNVRDIDNCQIPMESGEAWLAVLHNARAGQVYTETQFTVAPAPKGPSGIGSVAGMNGIGIMKGTPDKDLAILFLEFLTRPENLVKLARGTGGFIPTMEEALDILGDEPGDKVIESAILVLENGVLSGVPASDYQDWGEVKQVFDDAFVSIVLSDTTGTVDLSYLAQAQRDIVALKIEHEVFIPFVKR